VANGNNTFDYPAEDLLRPGGQNGLSARAAFYQRSLYKEAVYPATLPYPLDTWYDKFLYGRVDVFQNSIILKNQYLTSIKSADVPNIMALRPVVTAFEKFSYHMKKAFFMGVVSRNANPRLLDLKALRAHQPINSKHEIFSQHLFNVFLTTLRAAEANQITDFNSFIKIYKRYLLPIAAATPISKTNFVISQNNNLFTTGLTIAIAKEDSGDDFVKYSQFVGDPNFNFFRQCAKKFGFIVNKNAPWLLTADLFSTAFLQTALGDVITTEGAMINKQNFFNIYYDQPHTNDIEDIARIFINSYRALLSVKPFYDHETRHLRQSTALGGEISTVGVGCPVITKARKPLSLTVEQVLSGDMGGTNLTHKFLIDIYAELRNTEVGKPLGNKKLQDLKRNAYSAYQLKVRPELTGLQNAADYINTIYRNYIYDRGAVRLQKRNAAGGKGVDNRARGGRIITESDLSRQLY